MTRKDYVLLAEALKKARMPAVYEHDKHHNVGQECASRYVADALAADNPRFDRERFLRAAGVQL